MAAHIPTWHDLHLASSGLGGRAADGSVRVLGGWGFFWGMTVFICGWIVTGNALGFDRYPMQFLTLLLSLQASYAAPLILMASNRQAERDRLNAEHDRAALLEVRSELAEVKELLAALQPAN